MKKIKIIILICLTILQLSSFERVFAIDADSDNTISDQSIIQIEPTLVPVDVVPIINDLSADTIVTGQGVNLQTSSDVPLIQDTVNTQESSESDILIANPETTVSVVEPAEDNLAPTEEILAEEAPVENPEVVDVPVVDSSDNPEDQPMIQDNTINIQELKPKAIHTFALTSRKIKTKEIAENTDKDTLLKSASINNEIDPVIDNDKGTMSFSGVCNAKYFVVLLYKNENDYIDNSNSYIVNKAFECVGGNFSYTIDQLPKNLPDGNYYLLIGQQGETGSWTPISSLTEIVINKGI